MAVSFVWLKDEKMFYSSMRKMSLDYTLDQVEMEYMLSCAVLFLAEYSNDKRRGPYFDIAYYIVLKCAVNNGVYEPLLDVSSNFGLYPVSSYILRNKLFSSSAFIQVGLSLQLGKYEYKGIVETYEQKYSREAVLNSACLDNCYVAPTSFGKSSLVVELLKNKSPKKCVIVVPTKSLLFQTYKLLRDSFSGKKIIFHDEMYDGLEEFVAVFTQERALRLLKDEKVSFDLMVVDEAHNIFEFDSRSILLTRLIRRNKQRNPGSLVYYLSPLVADVDNLRVSGQKEILEHRVLRNVKELDVSELKEDGKVRRYNRFLDEFFHSAKFEGFLDYIIANAKSKNFAYLRAPRKIEEFSALLDSRLVELESDDLNSLSDVVARNVHQDFYCVDYIRKGLLYLHGKLPDLIKEYLEYKFSVHKELKYIVANSVILEGVNLPVDNMYILNTYSLDVKSLINLVGRVNRLSEAFDDERKSLDKLLPSVHFINSEFNRKSGNMANQIRMLKSGVFKDSVANPLLANFDFKKIENDLERAEQSGDSEKAASLGKKLERLYEVKRREDFLVGSGGDDRVRKVLLESNVMEVYFESGFMLESLEEKLGAVLHSAKWRQADVIDKVYFFFIERYEDCIANKNFLRLRNEGARSFYKRFVENTHRLSLKDHISDTIRYFQSIKDKPQGREFYIGESYGEFSPDSDSGRPGKNVYINLSKKTAKELANISMVKIKMENDFVSYLLNRFVDVLYDLNALTQSEYDTHIYGTDKKRNSEFVKIGVSGSLINRLDADGQIENIYINEAGIVGCNEGFLRYIKKQDDLFQFEVGKFIDVEGLAK